MSLRTDNHFRAEYLAGLLSQHLSAPMRTVMTPAQLTQIAREHLQEIITENETLLAERGLNQTAFSYAARGRPHGDACDADVEAIEQLVEELREQLGRNELQHIEGVALALLAKHGLRKDFSARLSRLLLQAQIQAWGITRERLKGKYEPLLLAEPAAAAAPMAAGPKLSEIEPVFVRAMTTARAGQKPEWSPHTHGQNENTLSRFREVCGDRPAAAYELKDIAHFLDTMRGLPTHYGQAPGNKKLLLSEITAKAKAQGDKLMGLSKSTLERHKATLGRLFTYLVQSGHRKDNPVDLHSFQWSEQAAERRPWSPDKLATFFASPFYTGARAENRRAKKGETIFWDHYYWLPLLGLYHGNRLEEFAQLRRRDVDSDDGIPFLRISGDDGNSIKNITSRRDVPIHPRILELGFLRYAATVAPAPGDRLFPGLAPGGKGRKVGHYFSKRFSAYRKQLGVYEKWRDYHSFRHGVETKLAVTRGLDQRHIDTLLGHAGKGTGDTYFDRSAFPMRDRLEIIKLVEFPEVRVTRAAHPVILHAPSRPHRATAAAA